MIAALVGVLGVIFVGMLLWAVGGNAERPWPMLVLFVLFVAVLAFTFFAEKAGWVQ